MLFPSPAEVDFIRIMGGKVITVNWLKHYKTGFPLVVVISLGKLLRRNLVAREVRVGKCWVDFGSVTPYYKKGIEIDGEQYHKDIVKQMERDEYFANYGWRVLHIKAVQVRNEPDTVQRKVLEFLAV